MNLTLKYRPEDFRQLRGQKSIARTLYNSLVGQTYPHSYLFSGIRGIGKTSAARILAKALNCQKGYKNSDRPNPNPCKASHKKICVSCKEVNEARSIDVIEIDGASHTGVDDIRTLILKNINMMPSRDRFKIFIIDEVHMLSKSSFNSLLKTVEEPPAHVVFIFATTEKYRVPDTIISRCWDFEFKPISTNEIIDSLTIIAKAENLTVEKENILHIAKSGKGSLRDAQRNLSKIANYNKDQITAESVEESLGIQTSNIIPDTIKAIASKDSTAVFKLVEFASSKGYEFDAYCLDLIKFVRDLLLFKLIGDINSVMFSSHIDDLQYYKNAFTNEKLLELFNAFSEIESKIITDKQGKYLLELTLLNMAK